MSFFGSSSDKYSSTRHQLSELDIKRLISAGAISSMDRGEETIIEEAVHAARGSDGKVSLRQIDEALKSLMDKRLISRNDREAVMRIFSKQFGE